MASWSKKAWGCRCRCRKKLVPQPGNDAQPDVVHLVGVEKGEAPLGGVEGHQQRGEHIKHLEIFFEKDVVQEGLHQVSQQRRNP